MAANRTQIGIALGAGGLLVLIFLGYLWWLSNQGPVLARSEERDPLTNLPLEIKMNPLRDRSQEHAAGKFLREMQSGECNDVLADWEHDYRKKYAHFICDSESQHKLVSWKLVEWEDTPPSLSLHYRTRRENGNGQPGTYQDLATVTLEKQNGQWVVTKYLPFN